MKQTPVVLLFVCLVVMLAPGAAGQKKFSIEKVTRKILEMDRYDADTSAAAVILHDIGKLSGSNMKFNRQMRIKILSKGGLEWGNQVFQTPSRGDFNVTVYNLVNGEVEAEKASAKSMYNEEVVDGFQVYKVFAPGVKVGSVIDILYSFRGLPSEWRFQERIPIVYNELSLGNSSWVTFNKTFFGFQPIQTISTDEWHASNMPAFKAEPFVNDYRNYISRFEFQISSLQIPGLPFMEYSTTWSSVNNLLLKHSRFGVVLNGGGVAFLNDFANDIKKKDLTIQQKIEAAYKYIQTNLKWDGTKTIYSSLGLRNKFTVDHNGNCGDINLALICLLKKMDINTYPVVLSTRDNGMLVQHSTQADKLNYVVAYVRHNDFEMLLDATVEQSAPGILPARCINGQGLVVKEDSEEWIDLNRGYKDVKKNFVTVTIANKDQVQAKVVRNFSGYGYLNWAEELKANSQDKEIQKSKIQKQATDYKILSYEINRNDPAKLSAQETIDVDATDQFIDTGSEFLFNPFVLFEYSANPFKSETRKYPVDLVSPVEISTTVLVNLQAGFTVKKMPEPVKFNSAGGSAIFTYLSVASETGLQFKITLQLNKPVYTESEYLELRQFFSEVIKKISTPIELMKT